MPQVSSELLKVGRKTNRIIDCITGDLDGPTIVFFAGIHGNEPAGVLALENVFQELREKNFSISGTIYGIAGNLNALQKKIRYQDEDLNRIWNNEKLAKIHSVEQSSLNKEEIEMLQLHEQLSEIIANSSPPLYFIDLHTTSGKTSPFIVVNDSLLNRRFVLNYSLPKVLGIEEYLRGALLSFINEMGYVSFGFESGQHDEAAAVTNNINFINYTLTLTSSLKPNEIWQTQVMNQVAKMSRISSDFFEITYEHHLKSSDTFKMTSGFTNFQKIRKGAKIACFNNEEVKAKKATQIFMPLYQNQGSEGFYFVKPVPRIFLWLSKYLRKIKLDNILTKLPGVAWSSNKKDALLINTKIAKYISKSLFHLLGYRVRYTDSSHLTLKSRESVSRDKEYPNSWI